MKFRRILLKLSGEMLGSGQGGGFDSLALARVAREVASVVAQGVQVAIVVGAGNLVRGAGPNPSPLPVRRQVLDTMGMLCTAVNALALMESLRAAGLEVRHNTALPAGIDFSSRFDADEALRFLQSSGVIVFSGGTGLPFFSTDTAAAVRAIQTGSDCLVKGTQVQGVYSADPRKPGNNARFLDRLSHRQVLEMNLQFMDAAAVALLAAHRVPILVYDAHGEGNLLAALSGSIPCSLVTSE